MKNQNIDDLLKVVSPDLVVGYEKKHLEGTTLWMVNEKYKGAKALSELLFKRHNYYFGLTFPVCLLLVGLLVIASPDQKLMGVAFIVWIILVGLFIYSALRLVDKAHESSREATNYGLILEGFRISVDGLNPISRLREFNKDSVREELVGCAVRLLNGEAQFDVIRMQKEREIYEIQRLGNFIEKARDKFENTFKCAQEFGLEFSKRELFADAALHIERSKQEIIARQQA